MRITRNRSLKLFRYVVIKLNANEMEFILKKCKVEIVKFGGKPVKWANGEMLTPIKLRVVGYKWNEQNLSI